MASKKYPIQKEHYPIFESRIRHWQNVFCLRDWRFGVSHAVASTPGAMAEVFKIDHEQKTAQFRLGKISGAAFPDEGFFDDLARHEVAHVWLSEFKETCQTPKASWESISGAEHRLINTLDHWVITLKGDK